MRVFHGQVLLEPHTLFQRHFSLGYLRGGPIGFVLIGLSYEKVGKVGSYGSASRQRRGIILGFVCI